MSTYFKNLPKGSPIYILTKGEDLTYREGIINNIGLPRMEVNQNSFPASRTVLDMTFTVDGKTYTEAVGEMDSMFQSKQFTSTTLIATDSDTILRELRATLKSSEDYIKSTETEIPKQQKRIEQCKELIGSLDTDYAEKKEFDQRIKRLEDGASETNSMLKEILKKLSK